VNEELAVNIRRTGGDDFFTSPQTLPGLMAIFRFSLTSADFVAAALPTIAVHGRH
jgi:hypothetical protein